jgi:transposase-like protein
MGIPASEGSALALHRLASRRFTARSSSAFSGHGFADEIVTLALRWYVRYRLSSADVAELLAERGVMVSPSTV